MSEPHSLLEIVFVLAGLGFGSGGLILVIAGFGFDDRRMMFAGLALAVLTGACMWAALAITQ